MIKNLYYAIIKTKFFNKIFVCFAFIVLLSFTLLALVVSQNISAVLLERDMKYNNLILLDVNKYLEQKFDLVYRVSQQAYLDNLTMPQAYDFMIASTSINEANYLQFKRHFFNYYNAAFSRDLDIKNIVVYKLLEKNFYIFSHGMQTEYAEDNFPYRERLHQLDEVPARLNITSSAIPSYNELDPSRVYTISNDMKYLGTNDNTGLLMVDFKTDGISQLLSQYDKNIKGCILVLTPQGEVIYDSLQKFYGVKYPFADLLKSTAKPIVIDGEESVINVFGGNSHDLVIAGIIPERQILSGIEVTKRLIYIIALICILLSILLSYASTVIFSKRIKTITKAMTKVHKGDFSGRIHTDIPGDEISEIAVNFNNMCDELEDYINKVYISEIRQKVAELTALQAQINPHFLYNTLESIRMKAIANNDKDVGAMIFLLSKLFRSSIKEGSMIRLQDEIEYSKMYLELFKIRYGDRLTFQFDFSEKIMNHKMVKHIIQPVIENYIVHGFDPDHDNNFIYIKGCMDDKYIIITVSDNGKGIEADQLESIRKALSAYDINNRESIGLANVHERIRIPYGNDCGINIVSTKGKGTTVTIKFIVERDEGVQPQCTKC